ncbi:hypothetical protein FB451DRAFT_1214412, partial [Mycena latifolia]
VLTWAMAMCCSLWAAPGQQHPLRSSRITSAWPPARYLLLLLDLAWIVRPVAGRNRDMDPGTALKRLSAGHFAYIRWMTMGSLENIFLKAC